MRLRHGDASLSIQMNGKVEISEGFPPKEGEKGWSSVKLVEGNNDVEFDVSTPEENEEDDFPDGLELRVHSFHQTDPETNRHFHCHIGFGMTRDQLRMLRDFLSFLLENTK